MPEPARYVPRWIYEGARDMACEIAKSWEGRTSRRLGKKIEMLFAHLKRHSQARPITLTSAKPPARRVHPRSHRPEPSADGQADPDALLEARIGTAKPMLVPQTGHRCPAFCREPEAHLFSTEACSIALSWD